MMIQPQIKSSKDEEQSQYRRVRWSHHRITKELVDERHSQGMTQHDISGITGILPSNIARLESGGRVLTLVVLQKYAAAVGKHIELKIMDGVE